MRASHRRGRITVSLRWPEGGKVRRSSYVELGHHARPTSAGYDRIAERALLDLLRIRPHLPIERATFARIVVRRVFQAPCPR
jgi:hypothetical protein